MEIIGRKTENGDIVPFRIAFITLGCKVNHYETDGIRQIFEGLGFHCVRPKEEADVYVINTCTVTSEADRKSGQSIRRAKAGNSKAVVAAMGCRVAIENGDADADTAAGTKDRLEIVRGVLNCLRNQYGDRYCGEKKDSEGCSQPSFPASVITQEETRAYIKIEDGCDAFCSYCIIPYARGRVCSRSREEIVAEAAGLAEKGFHEIVLTGIHLSSYGKDMGRDVFSLAEVAEEIAKIPGITRIRLGSLEPKSLTEAFIRYLARIPKLCPHFHLSLQSGSETVLRRMNRRYTTGEFGETLRLLREFFPGCGVTTDIIVGFPGESEEEHRESLSFCRDMAFSGMHIFPYSKRGGTRAAEMEPKISAAVTSSRKEDFFRLDKILRENFINHSLSSRCEVLIEKKKEGHTYEGYTGEYVRAHVTSSTPLDAGQVYGVLPVSQKNGEVHAVYRDSSCVRAE